MTINVDLLRNREFEGYEIIKEAHSRAYESTYERLRSENSLKYIFC
jgi:hypothetical protein